jgi:hypothetical protein
MKQQTQISNPTTQELQRRRAEKIECVSASIETTEIIVGGIDKEIITLTVKRDEAATPEIANACQRLITYLEAKREQFEQRLLRLQKVLEELLNTELIAA